MQLKISNVLIALVGCLEIIIGGIFVQSIASDIQLGFGIVLIAQGIIHLAKK